MKTIKQLFHHLALLVMIITGSNLQAQQKADFYSAKETLDSMLSGKTPLSFEKAVFVTENAYWGNKIKYTDFDNAINYNASKISMLAEVMHKYDTGKGRVIYPTDNKEQKIEGHNKLQKNWAIYTYMTDTTYFKHKDTMAYHLPYLYSRNDPYATIDWRNSQVTGLLNTHTGNCYAMACLYKIFADKLNTGAVIATAPGHAFIQHTDDMGTVFNMELASRCFRGSGSIETFTYTTNKAVESGIAMRALTDRQDVSMCLVYLAKGFESTFNTDADGFILNCAELALSYDSLNLNAMLLKAEVLEKTLINEQKSVALLQGNKTFMEYQGLVKHLYKLGYREMPIEMQNTILAKLKQDDYGTMANHEPQPFKTIKTNGQRTASLSSGLFEEEIKDKPVEKYHRTLFNAKTQTITAFTTIENTYDDYATDPVIAAMSVDPLTAKYPMLTPYQFASNKPISATDIDGMEAKAVNGGITDYPEQTGEGAAAGTAEAATVVGTTTVNVTKPTPTGQTNTSNSTTGTFSYDWADAYWLGTNSGHPGQKLYGPKVELSYTLPMGDNSQIYVVQTVESNMTKSMAQNYMSDNQHQTLSLGYQQSLDFVMTPGVDPLTFSFDKSTNTYSMFDSPARLPYGVGESGQDVWWHAETSFIKKTDNGDIRLGTYKWGFVIHPPTKPGELPTYSNYPFKWDQKPSAFHLNALFDAGVTNFHL